MASKDKRFLAPAHFQVSPKKDKKKTQVLDGRDVKLLPPTEYKVGKTSDVDHPRNQQAESFRERISELENAVNQLKLEKRHLLSQFEIAKNNELQLQEENRRNKLLLQRTRVDDVVDLRRLAETEEENLSLKTEARKQIAFTSKLKNDIHNIRTHYETEIETYESRSQTQTAALKQLKLELSEKEENYAKNSAILERRAKKLSCIVKELNAELQKAREKNESDRQQFENILGNNEAQKYAELQRLQQELRWSEQTHSKELTSLKEHLESKELSLINLIKDLSDKDIQIASLMNECKELQLKFQNELKHNKEKFHEREAACKQDVAELQADLKKCRASVNELQSKLKDKEKQLELQNLLSEQLKAYIGKNLPNTKIENLQRENEDLNSHITCLVQENEHLKTTVELLNVRLSSSKELLAIQEQELEKSQGQTFGEPKPSVDGLLERWRSKVFALLVQLKSEKLCQLRKEQQERTEVEINEHFMHFSIVCWRKGGM